MITGVLLFFLFVVSTPVPGVGKGLGTWPQGTGYTSAIAISLGNRKYFPHSIDEEIEAKGEKSKAFQCGKEPRALRLGLVAKYCSLALLDIPSPFGNQATLETRETLVAKDKMWDTVYTTQPSIWNPSHVKIEGLRPQWVNEVGKENLGGYSSFSKSEIYVPFG